MKDQRYNSLMDHHEYIVRESQRAKHVNLRYSVEAGLEIVVPRGYDQRKIPEVLEQKRQWLNKAKRRIEEERSRLPANLLGSLPDKIALRAIDACYDVEYFNSSGRNLSLIEQANSLILRGDTSDNEWCIKLIDRWLRDTAKKHLPPWLRRTSHDLNLPYEKTTIRGQKTRWGSCSSQKTISLNYKLMFLPNELVHYLFVHELCHTRHMNHSARYWKLVEEKYPAYRDAERALKSTAQYLPLWLKG